MRSMYLLDDERVLVKRVARLVKHGTPEARLALNKYAAETTSDADVDLRHYGINRKAYTIRAYDEEWELIQGVMRVAKRRGYYQQTRAFLTRLEDAVLL